MTQELAPSKAGNSVAVAPDSRTDKGKPGDSEVLRLIHELKYGSVEVIVHQGDITEIRQTRRLRVSL